MQHRLIPADANIPNIIPSVRWDMTPLSLHTLERASMVMNINSKLHKEISTTAANKNIHTVRQDVHE